MTAIRKIGLIAAIFATWTLLMVAQKPVFLLFYGGLSHVGAVVLHGLPLDLSVAGYLTAPAAVVLLAASMPFQCLHTHRAHHVLSLLLSVWTVVGAVASAMAFTANIALYGYWHYPLDATPVFFLTSSPSAALASVSGWQLAVGLVSVAVLTIVAWWAMRLLFGAFNWSARCSWKEWPVMGLAVAALFLPIRGGVSVATMNTGVAYFSSIPKLNHAAVNPVFSFMESMTHQDDFAQQYRYMDDNKAHSLFNAMRQKTPTEQQHQQVLDTIGRLPDVYIIIMESFSDTVTQVKGVTPKLNALKRSSLWFNNFYANSFRTDRGLLSNLLGVPAPAMVSLMKYPRKTRKLPSLAACMVSHGYGTHYYYGGDADFTNMRSFLVDQGFKDITEMHDFPLQTRLSKWGVPDHLVFQKVEEDLRHASRETKPMLRVIQTSSSHEPFDVPYHRLRDKKLNAFAYADHSVGSFVDWLKASGLWSRSLIVLVPDHLGAWPADADDYAPWRYHVPMIWTGGAVTAKGHVPTYGSQQDIAATLLAQLGMPHGKFAFSKDLFDPAAKHYAFFMMEDGFGLADPTGYVVYDHKRGKTVKKKGPNAALLCKQGMAITQVLYDMIAKLE